ncbi:snapalysin family zinc-dependent metalloprotease [Streptomyces sp. NBC_01020]|uniref:snapalysin family zinc-dependent metalloprotease n=1 Tax=unclassified Streptomyces TaxID=2593676 RepID=UPI0022569568|nr:snapalysin family zinc-dependent metalloprotease [Streptomyces sp. NBC_01306]MCX4725397.1 snapalysin family zinc-dependent metalloprotease [Streptomyces sp. NBC_01306]WSV05207.1 snapalysin family zinc-dependent metalloprotease [Streptomyces sp. NBC_01020]
MIKRMAAVAALVPVALGVTSGAASAHPAPRATAAVVTLTYDASGAGQWADAITQGVNNWNAADHNVHLQPATSRGSANFVYVATSGWPQTTLGPIVPGGSRGQVQLGQEAVDEGYDMTRIAAHETGHILGLPDDYSGPCSELMSGHGPGTSCTNAKPNAAEAAQVDRNYASGAAKVSPKRHQIVIDAWHEPVLAGAH